MKRRITVAMFALVDNPEKSICEFVPVIARYLGVKYFRYYYTTERFGRTFYYFLSMFLESEEFTRFPVLNKKVREGIAFDLSGIWGRVVEGPVFQRIIIKHA